MTTFLTPFVYSWNNGVITNSYSIDLLSKSIEIAKITFSVQKKKKVTVSTFYPVPRITWYSLHMILKGHNTAAKVLHSLSVLNILKSNYLLPESRERSTAFTAAFKGLQENKAERNPVSP